MRKSFVLVAVVVVVVVMLAAVGSVEAHVVYKPFQQDWPDPYFPTDNCEWWEDCPEEEEDCGLLGCASNCVSCFRIPEGPDGQPALWDCISSEQTGYATCSAGANGCEVSGSCHSIN